MFFERTRNRFLINFRNMSQCSFYSSNVTTPFIHLLSFSKMLLAPPPPPKPPKCLRSKQLLTKLVRTPDGCSHLGQELDGNISLHSGNITDGEEIPRKPREISSETLMMVVCCTWPYLFLSSTHDFISRLHRVSILVSCHS